MTTTSEFLTDTQAQEQAQALADKSVFNKAAAAGGAKNEKQDEVVEEVEMVFLQDNPMVRIKDQDRPRGSFLFLPMRTTADKIWYGTGIAYFTGLAYGGVYGTYRGLTTAPNALFKVKLNSIMNQTTRYGPWAANSLGVLALSWSLIDSLAGAIRDKDDYYNHVGAAFTTGLLFKSTAGTRQALTSAFLLGGVAAVGCSYDFYQRNLLKQQPTKPSVSSSSVIKAVS